LKELVHDWIIRWEEDIRGDELRGKTSRDRGKGK
jgi:hypothetical protein